MQAIFGIGGRLLISHFAAAQTLQAYRQPFVVHHGEHGSQTAIAFTQKKAGSAIVVDDICRTAANTHLVLYGAAAPAVALTQTAVFCHHKLRHNKQRNALGTAGCVWQPCQHQVNYVVRKILFTSGNKYFRTRYGIATIGIGLGLGTQDSEVSTGMGFG